MNILYIVDNNLLTVPYGTKIIMRMKNGLRTYFHITIVSILVILVLTKLSQADGFFIP